MIIIIIRVLKVIMMNFEDICNFNPSFIIRNQKTVDRFNI